ncbi:MAG: insulinase family protein [Nitrospirae bacterium]|nr:insulinase family protein [Nitrospirota bacterium]
MVGRTGSRPARGGASRKIVLDNGIRVVAERIPSVRSVSLGVWVTVGSRDEGEAEGADPVGPFGQPGGLGDRGVPG